MLEKSMSSPTLVGALEASFGVKGVDCAKDNKAWLPI